MTKRKEEREKVGQGVGGGPPRIVLTEEQLIKVEAWASTVSNIEKIADLLGISRTLFYELRKRQPEVRERYLKGSAYGETRAAKTLLERGMEGDSKSLMWYLDRKWKWGPERHAQNVVVEGENKLSVSIEFGDSGIEE